MNNVVTMMDAELVDGYILETENPVSLININDTQPRFNPDKDQAMKIINEIYENDGKCKNGFICPCRNLIRYGHCARGLFKG